MGFKVLSKVFTILESLSLNSNRITLITTIAFLVTSNEFLMIHRKITKCTFFQKGKVIIIWFNDGKVFRILSRDPINVVGSLRTYTRFIFHHFIPTIFNVVLISPLYVRTFNLNFLFLLLNKICSYQAVKLITRISNVHIYAGGGIQIWTEKIHFQLPKAPVAYFSLTISWSRWRSYEVCNSFPRKKPEFSNASKSLARILYA